MKYKLRYKLLSFLSLSFFGAFALASCTKTKVSAVIDGKKEYASANGYTITNKELWDELKWNSYDVLNKKIEEAILKDEIAEAQLAIDIINGTETNTLGNLKLKRYLDYLENLAMSEIYSLTDIEDVKTFTAAELAKKTQVYVDTIYLEDAKKCAASDFEYSAISAKARTMFAGTRFEETYYLYEHYDRYKFKLAQKIYAYNVLADEIKDHDKKADDDDEMYYTTEDILQYQKEHYQYSADRQALIIRFTNDDEIKSTFKAYGIKVYKNQFYYIPANGKTNVEYSKYYDEFSIESPSNSGLCVNLTALGGDALIFELYSQIYNYIYTYRAKLPTRVNVLNDTIYRRDITEAIVSYFENNTTDPADYINAEWDSDEKEILNHTQDDLNEIDSNFKLLVSKTLKVNPDKTEGEMRYSTEGKAYGTDFTYMVFKVSEDELEDWYYLCDEEMFDEKNPKIDETDEKVKSYKAELIEEMMWDEITDSYIENRFQDAKDDTKVSIYNSDIEIVYSSNKKSYSKTHKDAPSKSTLLTVSYKKKKTNISVLDVYDELEKKNGVTTAIDLLSRKAIKATEQYKDTNTDRKDYKQTIELLLAYFANGSLSGYDSSLGKYNFLKLYFHSTDIDYIIDNTYRVNAASAKILTDYANNDSFYKMVQDYAYNAYTKSFTVSASNLLVYVDMDEDGKPDEDFDWTTVDMNSGQSYKDLAIELINKAIVSMENSPEQTVALSTFNDEFKACQRFTNGIDEWYGTNEEYDPTTVESRWAKYKRAGLYVSSTDYSSVGINTIESSTDSSVPSTIVKDRLHELYLTITKYGLYPQTYVDDTYYKDGTGFMDKNGYSLLVLTGCTERSTAEFKATDDANSRYKDIVVEYDDTIKNITDIYNYEGATAGYDEGKATIDQITLFIYEYLTYETSDFFPSSVQSYITDYIMPVYQRYTASASQRELLLSKMLGGSINFVGNPDNNERLTEIMAINRRQADSYLSDTDDANLYSGWWTEIMNLKLGGE